MNTNLVRKLINCGAIRQDTVIEIEYSAAGLSCTERAGVRDEFVIRRGVNDMINDRVVFDVIKDEKFLRIDCNAIRMIDGMDPERFAKIYHLDINGVDLPVPKKRGRVPRAKLEEMARLKQAA